MPICQAILARISDVYPIIKKAAPKWRGLLQIPDEGIWPDSGKVLQGLAAADDAQQDDHNRDYQQYMYEAADGIRTDQTDEPQDNEYDCNGIEHGNVL